MIRTSLRRPEGPAEIVADALRVIVVAGIGWDLLSGLSFMAASAAMLIPRLMQVRPALDLLFGSAVLVSTWSSVLGLFITTRWWDIPMQQPELFVRTVRQVLRDAKSVR